MQSSTTFRISSSCKIVTFEEETLLGFCASFQYRAGEVFSRTVETSIYTSLHHQSRGLGLRLYKTLFEQLAETDLHLAVVGIALPNEKSIGLHKKVGFEEVGTFKEYAFFQEKFVSSMWMQKLL